MYAGNGVNVVIAEGEDLTFGIRKTTTISTDWAIFDNFKLFYLGTEAPVAIQSINASAAVTSTYFNISGVKTACLRQGINIVKMSDGTVKKVFTK